MELKSSLDRYQDAIGELAEGETSVQVFDRILSALPDQPVSSHPMFRFRLAALVVLLRNSVKPCGVQFGAAEAADVAEELASEVAALEGFRAAWRSFKSTVDARSVAGDLYRAAGNPDCVAVLTPARASALLSLLEGLDKVDGANPLSFPEASR